MNKEEKNKRNSRNLTRGGGHGRLKLCTPQDVKCSAKEPGRFLQATQALVFSSINESSSVYIRELGEDNDKDLQIAQCMTQRTALRLSIQNLP